MILIKNSEKNTADKEIIGLRMENFELLEQITLNA
jgi:hypothetical protein